MNSLVLKDDSQQRIQEYYYIAFLWSIYKFRLYSCSCIYSAQYVTKLTHFWIDKLKSR